MPGARQVRYSGTMLTRQPLSRSATQRLSYKWDNEPKRIFLLCRLPRNVGGYPMAPKPTPQNRLCVGPETVLISYELPPLEIQESTRPPILNCLPCWHREWHTYRRIIRPNPMHSIVPRTCLAEASHAEIASVAILPRPSTDCGSGGSVQIMRRFLLGLFLLFAASRAQDSLAQLIWTGRTSGHTDPVFSVAFRPTGRYLPQGPMTTRSSFGTFPHGRGRPASWKVNSPTIRRF